jgi:uncharacterized protein (DUF58 family)
LALPVIATDTFSRFDRLSLVSQRTAQDGLGGEHRSRRRAPSTEFVDYRPYQPGDDFRRVDWNVYGRLGTLQVKLTEARERLDVLLVLDCSASMAFGEPSKLAMGANVVAALSYVALGRSDTLWVVALRAGQPALLAGPLRGRARFAEVLHSLSRQSAGGELALNAALADCLPVGGGQRLVVFVSDLLTPDGIADGLDALLARRADVVVLHVCSPDEGDPRLAGEIELIDAETGEREELGASLATLDAYRHRYTSWIAEQERACTSRGLRYVRLSSDRPLPSVMLDDLRRAEVVR